MKTIEQKAKAYDEALKVLHKYDGANIMFTQDLKEEIFPELTESEDERIRKWLINLIKGHIEWLEDRVKEQLSNGQVYGGELNEAKDAIAWLEKQGEQKPTDKVEPKFKVGDWVVYNRNNNSREIMQIYDIRDGRYYFTDNVHFSWSIKECDEKSHFWTIEDAKDGDVLCTYECGEPKIVFILKGTPKKHYALSYHCYYNIMYPHFASDSEKGCLASNDEDVKPATKEQRNLLFQKMREAGYEWDSEKKELKKISQEYPLTPDECIKFVWSEEDEERLNSIISDIKTDMGAYPRSQEVVDYYNDDISFLKSLKDRVQPKQEWSKEDNPYYDDICEILINLLHSETANINKDAVQKDLGWLKSLRYQNRWKPSEEQIRVVARLRHCLLEDVSGNDVVILDNLLEQLKAL